MKNNENYIYNNKIKIVLICILILNCILMGYLTFKNSKYNRPASSQNSSTDTFGFDNAQELLSVTLKSENLSAGEISSRIERFATGAVPFINKNVLQSDSTDIENLYKENKGYLEVYAGIETEKEFKEMCNKLKKVECNLNEISSASYISNTAEYNNNEFKINVKLIDNNNNFFTITLSYISDNEVAYKYDILEK